MFIMIIILILYSWPERQYTILILLFVVLDRTSMTLFKLLTPVGLVTYEDFISFFNSKLDLLTLLYYWLKV